TSIARYLQWSPEQARNFGIVPQSCRHRVHELPWFTDEGLIQLIDRQPREKLRVFMSGTDPEHRQRDHQPVDTEGANAAEILESVKKGRLWVNLQRIDTVDERFNALGKRLYGELEQQCEHFHPVWINRAFLFISSPRAMVYLHADYQPNMLWHIRGEKKIWIYPAYDSRFVSRERIEEICSGGEDDIEYKPEFDQNGQCFSIGPGETVSWPARSPHRVENGDSLNASLSTFHETIEDYARVLEHKADFMLRTRAPRLSRLVGSGKTSGALKRVAYQAMSKFGWALGRPAKEYYAGVRIDPEAPLGVREIPNGPVLTEHSRLATRVEVRKAA
ncbi:MAG: cupin-like domain-containing protein, partial [Thermomicrobiales bacterium]